MFGFTILGTGVARPGANRRLSSAFVQIHGDRYLLDVPEGTQLAMQQYNTGFNIDGILLTGLRGENLLGLPGLLATLGNLGNLNPDDDLEDITIYAPSPGGSKGDEQMRNRLNKFTTLVDNACSVSINAVEPDETLVETDDYSLATFRTKRKGGVSVGYRLYEGERKGEFDRDHAEELGVPVGPKFGRLHNGEAVELDNGRVIQPEQVVGEPRPGRSFAYTGATEHHSELGASLKNTDVVLCDGGITSKDFGSEQPDGHMSAYQAGAVAESANASVLFPTHIRGAYGPNAEVLKPDIEEAFDGIYTISRDGMAFEVLTRDDGGRATHRSDIITEFSD